MDLGRFLQAQPRLRPGVGFVWGPLLPYRFNRGSASGDSGKLHGIPSLKHFFNTWHLKMDGWKTRRYKPFFLRDSSNFFKVRHSLVFGGVFVDSLCVSERVPAFQILSSRFSTWNHSGGDLGVPNIETHSYCPFCWENTVVRLYPQHLFCALNSSTGRSYTFLVCARHRDTVLGVLWQRSLPI